MNTQTFEEPINITHNESANRFETTIDSHTGYISYQDRGNELVYDHTVVPQQLGGRGLGSALVKHALDFARQQEKKWFLSVPLYPLTSAKTLSTKTYYS